MPSWPAEFDNKFMVRATRLPLGYAWKIFVKAGDRDCNGIEADADAAGYYYGWWRGLHPLVGKEGLDARIYQIRPPYEEFKAPGMTWFVESRCVVQLPSGDPSDPTFKEYRETEMPQCSVI